MRRVSFAIVSLFLAFSVACGGKQKSVEDPPDHQVPPASNALPLDPAVRTGTLANGLTYYVRKHSKPAKRAYLWLAVNAGSTQEDDDQLGLAHFVEHMAFNGTKKFAKQEIINYMERIGMAFGPHVNASTDFERTIYKLQVPTEDSAVVVKGLTILQEWAQGVAFEDEEIEKERGVVLEERRSRRGPEIRILEKLLDKLAGNSMYAKRLPIGDPKIIKNAPGDAVRRFYRDWYRPELMVVIAVGDFDPLEVERQIQNSFGELASPDSPRARVENEVADFSGTRFAIEEDPELPISAVAIANKLPRQEMRTRDDYKRVVSEQLYNAMLNARLDELRQQANPPFLGAQSIKTAVVPAVHVFARAAVVKKGEMIRGLEAMVTEVERVTRHGFTETELSRAKADMLSGYERSAAERDQVDGSRYVQEILRHEFEGEGMPGIDYELALVRELLPTITVKQLNGLAAEWGGADNRYIIAVGPEGSGLPDEKALLATIEKVKGAEIAAYDDQAPAGPILTDVLPAGTIVETNNNAKLGTTEWSLSNGVKVVLKPTKFKNDEVMLLAQSRGGTSLLPDADSETGERAAAIVLSGGLGDMNMVQLNKALSGKTASVNATIDEYYESMHGASSAKDVETMFQLVHLAFTRPRKDEDAFASWKTGVAEGVATRLTRPEAHFDDAFYKVLFSDHPRRQPLTKESLETITLDRAFEIYEQRFANAADFTFTIVGTFEISDIEPLVTKYIASLPGDPKKREQWKNVGVVRPKKVRKVEVHKGLENKSSVRIVFPHEAKWSAPAAHSVASLAHVLRIRLRETMREEMGGVYGVGVSGSIIRDPFPRASYYVSFDCDPANVDKLVKAVFDEIAAIKNNGVGDEYLEKVREAQLRSNETALKDNGYWLGQLSSAYLMGHDPTWMLRTEELVKTVTSKEMRATARKYINTKRYVLGVLYPEKTK